MAGLIPQSFIDNLLDRVDIVELVDSRVKLKRSGKNYSACCPFHEEKTPSFTVSPDKQFYYCFGCGASGNALGFVMDYERLSFPEAVEQLARLTSQEVPREVQTEAQAKREEEKRSIYSLLQKADEFYQQQLRQHPSKHMAVNYLKGRGLDGKTAKDYGIGFAPPGWDNLLKALAHTDEDKHLLIEGGMLIYQEQDKRVYDRFRHRIMFPIRDTRGRVIGFGGRVLGNDKPKYLNSPETPVFHKGQELYGLYEARLAYRDLPRLLVVEGYMDVVSLAQFGIRYGVATLGTACGEEHLNRAFKYTSEVVFCFDGDQAGRTAAKRALEASISSMSDGRRVKFLFLPEGEDPDTLVRQIGAEKFERMIELAVPFEDYLFDAAAEGLDIRTMEGRASFSRRAAPLLERLPKGVFRELMFENLATRTGLSRKLLQELGTENPEPLVTAAAEPQPVAQSQAAPLPVQAAAPRRLPETDTPTDNWQPTPDWLDEAPLPEAPPPGYGEHYDSHQHHRPRQQQLAPRTPGKYLMPPVRKAIALLLTYPDLAKEEGADLDMQDSDDRDEQLLSRLLKLVRERPHYQLPHIIGYWRASYGAEEAEYLAAIAGHDLLVAANALTQPRPDKAPKADYDTQTAFRDALAGLARQWETKKNHLSLEKLKQADFNQLTREERERLVREILARKTPPPA
jgi:DNA primase